VRIVGGSARGRALHAPKGDATRPTSDRVRQSLFDLLGQRCDGLNVLDLYAGTGALALEALSRGAQQATLVESAKAAQQVIERNASELGFDDRVILLSLDVAHALRLLAARGAQFDLAFADPPYALRASQMLADALPAVLAPNGRIAIERSKRDPPPQLPASLEPIDERTWGDTTVLLARKVE
jgi:16S rRNA (guanine(966)-N(2))-methyltransferase RsmD